MKENENVDYREVLFVDMSSGNKYVCGSSVKTAATTEYEGKTYPSVKVSIIYSLINLTLSSVDLKSPLKSFITSIAEGKQCG